MQDFDIQEELKKLPDKPGVYIMHDKHDNIIYVGKAIILKNRVRSYFRESTKKSPKITEMVKRIDYFEYIVTDSELEALVLECNLIKEHRPKYNTMLKDDKSYPYIKVNVQDPYPSLIFARKMKKDKAKYYGPYTSSFAVKETIDFISKIYKLRDCRYSLPDNAPERCCLNYHIGKCMGPCKDMCTKEEYAQGVAGALDFLNGNYDPVISYVTEQMYAASAEMEYEKAAQWKELLGSVKAVAQKQKISGSDGEDKDVVALCRMDEDAVVAVFFIRNGRMTGREHFFMTSAGTGSSDVHSDGSADDPESVGSQSVMADTLEEGRILQEFIKQFYMSAAFVPREIIAQHDFEEHALIEEWLTKKRGLKVTVRVPVKGTKEKLVELAAENARMILAKDKDRIKRQEGRTIGAVAEIADILGLKNIKRMEAFDISNISGYESVGSMVVFESGRPKKNDYRRFKIKTVTGPDDYASMEEVIRRRFIHAMEEMKQMTGSADVSILSSLKAKMDDKRDMSPGDREKNPSKEESLKTDGDPEIKVDYEISREDFKYGSFTNLPDLIMMDGGKGQVHSCLKVLDELDIHIPVCGMVKDDHHRTRGLYYNDKELPIDTRSEGFKLITRVQDEAHRFAIEYHRSLRSRGQIKSVLDDIEGIGQRRKMALLRRFGSVEGIQAATLEELENTESMDAKSAGSVYAFFHEEDSSSLMS